MLSNTCPMALARAQPPGNIKNKAWANASAAKQRRRRTTPTSETKHVLLNRWCAARTPRRCTLASPTRFSRLASNRSRWQVSHTLMHFQRELKYNAAMNTYGASPANYTQAQPMSLCQKPTTTPAASASQYGLIRAPKSSKQTRTTSFADVTPIAVDDWHGL